MLGIGEPGELLEELDGKLGELLELGLVEGVDGILLEELELLAEGMEGMLLELELEADGMDGMLLLDEL